jgi:hypothetical protein
MTVPVLLYIGSISEQRCFILLGIGHLYGSI